MAGCARTGEEGWGIRPAHSPALGIYFPFLTRINIDRGGRELLQRIRGQKQHISHGIKPERLFLPPYSWSLPSRIPPASPAARPPDSLPTDAQPAPLPSPSPQSQVCEGISLEQMLAAQRGHGQKGREQGKAGGRHATETPRYLHNEQMRN